MTEETKIPEKYISIEYDTWFNKYKPLEQENEMLKKQIEENKVRVRISLSGEYEYNIGYVELRADVGYEIKIIDRDAIEKALRSHDRYSWHYLSRDAAEEKAKAINDLLKKNISAKEKIKKVPKIIRWLFRIKIAE